MNVNCIKRGRRLKFIANRQGVIMDLFLPVFKVVGMGVLGYGFGAEIKSKPNHLAVTWAVAELAVQLILWIQGKDDPRKIQYPLRTIVGGVASLYLANQLKITKVAHVVLSMIVFNVVPDIVDRLARV